MNKIMFINEYYPALMNVKMLKIIFFVHCYFKILNALTNVN